jgi:hypothetical protein
MKTPETKLERVVAKWLRSTGRDYDNKAQGAYDDLMQGGCQSGMVGAMIYYRDTVKFYKKHMAEIDAMLQESCSECGCTPAELFGEKWEDGDPLARDDMNMNLLAWFGFEETARHLMED